MSCPFSGLAVCLIRVPLIPLSLTGNWLQLSTLPFSLQIVPSYPIRKVLFDNRSPSFETTNRSVSCTKIKDFWDPVLVHHVLGSLCFLSSPPRVNWSGATSFGPWTNNLPFTFQHRMFVCLFLFCHVLGYMTGIPWFSIILLVVRRVQTWSLGDSLCLRRC